LTNYKNASYKDIKYWEDELKKRWVHPYSWGMKQTNELDRLTKFIYNTNTFNELEEKIKKLKTNSTNQAQLENYAMNRWYNFHSAMCVEQLFLNSARVTAANNRYDKLKDFMIDNIPFDHKTTIFPKGFGQSFEFALENPKELTKWLYIHQSKEGRFHLKNRIFIVLSHPKDHHWKLKAELHLIQKKVEAYLSDFHSNNLITLTYSSGRLLTDLIFVKM